jgi:membrane-bound lytic murein transglycosylase A
MRWWALAAIVLVASLQPPEKAKAGAVLKRVSYTQLTGWPDGDHQRALKSLSLSCERILQSAKGFRAKAQYSGKRDDWLKMCRTAVAVKNPSRQAARAFFEEHLQPVLVEAGTGANSLFTGYYEPEVAGSRSPGPEYPVPIYGKPDDLIAFNKQQRQATGLRYGRLVSGKPRPYLTRKQIENGGLSSKKLELVWLKSWADAFFMHVQGSGRVRLDDGTFMRLGFAAKTGLPYTAIGAILIKWGEVARENMSMQAIRTWMDANPARSRELMWHNESFIFFRRLNLPDGTLGPVGAHGVQLQAGHSLAVDGKFWAYGTPVWLETTLPGLTDQPSRQMRQLMIAQDTGSAIKGLVRGDIFFGSGKTAEQLAGHMQQPGRMFVLLPHAAVRRLGIGK